MKKTITISFFVLLFTIFITSFSLIIQAEEQPITQDKPASDEMTVYIIRESGFVGAARGVWVACNETVLASLSSGNYCCFKIKSGPNIINAVQAKAPAGFYLLKYSPGETVYLLYKYTKGTITLVTPEDGEKLVMKGKNVPVLEKSEPNDAYEFSLMNLDFLGTELMKKTEETIEPDSDNAVITFIRPGEFIKNAPFGIWSEAGYLGTLKGQTYFQIKVKPGKHFFIGKSEKFSVVEAEVAAGKKYYIEFKAKMGWFLAAIELLPVKKETEAKTLQKWLEGSTLVTCDQNIVTDELKAVMEKTKVVIAAVLKEVENGEIEPGKLLVEDGK
jgi:hypothetical protein